MAYKGISDKILVYLKRQDWPITTEHVAKKLDVSWNTAQVYLLKLAADGKVTFRKVGRQNEFCIAKGQRKNG